MAKHICTIYLVRHGESEHNAAGLLTGHTESNLTTNGKQQVLATRQVFEDQGIHFDEVYSSPMIRAVETAEILAGGPVPKDHQIEGLKERTFGSLEGKPEKNIEPFRRKHHKMPHKEAWVYRYVPDMESDKDVSSRVLKAVKDIAQKNIGKTILVVGHGGAIRTSIMLINGLTTKDLPPGSLKNAAYAKLEYDGKNLSVDEFET